MWDLPVRLFHWLLVPLIAFSWWSAEEARLDWHRLSGYAILTLVLFRVLWGLFGSETARFGFFLRGPGSIGSYLKGTYTAFVGHNPMGGWSVLAMIALLVAQTALGLFSVDVDGIESGPLAVFVSFDQGRVAAEAHHLVFNGLLVLIALHVLTVLFYLVFKRDNLVGPMVTGRKRVADGAVTAPKLSSIWLALFFLILGRRFHLRGLRGVLGILIAQPPFR